MALTAIEQVRLKTSDQPMFVREDEIEGNGVDRYFKLQYHTIQSVPAPVVYLSGTVVDPLDYVVDLENGSILFDTAPGAGLPIIFEYKTIIYTDAEVEQFLLDAGNDTNYAAALNLLAWSANAAKLAKKQSLAGGGGPGSETLDTAVTAEQLRKSAKEYLTLYSSYAVDDITGPADGITEIAWTEHAFHEIYEQALIRES